MDKTTVKFQAGQKPKAPSGMLREQETGTLPEPFRERINISSGRLFGSNCIGTALYITGERKIDGTVDTFEAHNKYLKSLTEIKNPVVGCLVVWWGETVLLGDKTPKINVHHMGVVVSTDPLLVTNREGGDDEARNLVNENESFESLCNQYRRSKVSFYLPKALVW
ncbi:MAG: hypothetical protein KGH94_04350 [Candidatus Micrarchaeota archaeon]|nr:hypothetical protein [Candidatus Micrarchaeota archaeon]